MTQQYHAAEDAPGATDPSVRGSHRKPGSDLGLPPWLAPVVLGAGILVQAFVLVHFARQLWFVGDDWDFLLRRGTIPQDARSWLDPKNGHWSTLTIVVYRALFAVFGLRTYLPYAMVTIALHLAIAALWYGILRQALARRGTALAGSWVILFLGVGGEALMYSAAMNHLWSILAALVAVLVRLRRLPSVLAVVALLASVMFSNTGVPAVFFVVTFVALHEGVRRAARLAVLPAIAYVVWYSLYGHVEANTQLPATGWDYLRIPELVWEGLTTSVGSAVGYADAGPAVLIALVVGTLVVRTSRSALRHLAWAGLASAVLVAAVLALSRQFAEQGAGRYSYYIVVFLVPAVALCAEGVVRLAVEPRWLMVAVIGALMAGYAVNGVSAERTFTNQWRFITGPERDRVLGMVAAADHGESTLNDSSGLDYDPDVNPTRLTQRSIRPQLPAGRATEKGRLDAEALFMVSVGPRSRVTGQPGGIGQIPGSFDGDVTATTGCHRYRATAPRPALVIGTGQGAEVTVSSNSTEVVTQLARGKGATSLKRTWKVEPGRVYVSTTAKDALLFVTFNGAGEFEVCQS